MNTDTARRPGAPRFVGASFPQSSVPFGALRAAAIGIGRVCAARGILGFVGVDFVAYQHPEGLRLLAVDLNLRYTDTLAAFHMFDFLMVSAPSFNPLCHCLRARR